MLITNFLLYRVGANVPVFGRNYKVANLEISRYSSNNDVYDKIYLWSGIRSSLNKNLLTKNVTTAVKRDISAYGSLTLYRYKYIIMFMLDMLVLILEGECQLVWTWGCVVPYSFHQKVSQKQDVMLSLSYPSL